MKERINTEDIKKFKHAGNIFTVLLVLSIVLPIPLTYFFGTIGFVVWLSTWIAAMIFAFRVEKLKKAHDIKTYREIVAFTEGRTLDELEKSCERGKRPYQEIFYIIGIGLITAIVCAIFLCLLI